MYIGNVWLVGCLVGCCLLAGYYDLFLPVCGISSPETVQLVRNLINAAYVVTFRWNFYRYRDKESESKSESEREKEREREREWINYSESFNHSISQCSISQSCLRHRYNISANIEIKKHLRKSDLSFLIDRLQSTDTDNLETLIRFG